MALDKRNLFSPEGIQLTDFVKALSHLPRVKVLDILTDKNVCMCGDIVDLLPLSQSTVSHHLRELKRMGLINTVMSN